MNVQTLVVVVSLCLIACEAEPFEESDLERADETEAFEVGSVDSAATCADCEDRLLGIGRGGSGGGGEGGGRDPSWKGGPQGVECWIQQVTHPLGYAANRNIIGQGRAHGLLPSIGACYEIADIKSEIGAKVAEGLAAVNPVAAAIVFVATFNVEKVTRCACEEYTW
jgi:hypothetical protein